MDVWLGKKQEEEKDEVYCRIEDARRSGGNGQVRILMKRGERK